MRRTRSGLLIPELEKPLVWGVDLAPGGGGGGGGFSPSDVAGMWGWWKPETLAAYADGAAVTQWDDSSGNARHLVQSSATWQPVCKESILNGNDVVRFTATDFLEIPSVVSPWASGDLAVFIVIKVTAATAQTFLSTRSAAGGWIWRTTTTGHQFTRIGEPGSTVDTCTITDWNMLTQTNTGLTPASGHNGTSVSSSAYSSYPPASTRFDVGLDFQSGVPLTGDVAEIIVYTTLPSAGERDSIEAYIASKYGLTIV